MPRRESNLPAGKAGKGKTQQTETPQTQRTPVVPQLQGATGGPDDIVVVPKEIFAKITKLIENARAFYSDPSALPLTHEAQANCIHSLLYQVRGIENTEEWKRLQVTVGIRTWVSALKNTR